MSVERRLVLSSFVAGLLLTAACGKRDVSSDSAASRTAAAGTAAAAVPAAECAATGHWIPCQVVKRLRMAGLAPRDSVVSDTVALGPTPSVYVAGGSALVVYLFPDSMARRRAAATLDTTRFIPPDAPLTMRHESTAIQNDNLLAILHTQRDQQRERVSNALMAGAPRS